MIQQVLAESAWQIRLTADDLRGLTPLVYSRVNLAAASPRPQLPASHRSTRFGPNSVGTQMLLDYDL
jgi:hypothetical protein